MNLKKKTQKVESVEIFPQKKPVVVNCANFEWESGRLGESGFIRMMYAISELSRKHGFPTDENALISKYHLQELRLFIDKLCSPIIRA